MARKREKRQRASARRRAEQRDSQRGGNNYINLPEGFEFFQPESEGPYRLDFFPYIVGKGNPFAGEGEEHFERTFYIHKGVGPNRRWVICPQKTSEKKCPICEDLDRLRKEADNDDEEAQQMIKDLSPKERQAFVLKDHGHDDPNQYLVWDFSYHMFGKQLDGRVKDSDEDDEYEFFACLEGGSTLRVGFEEKSFNKNKYYETRSIDFKKRPDLPDSVLEETPCLDELLNILSYDQLKEMYLQEPGADEEEAPKEEKPKRGRRKKEEKPEPSAEEEDSDDGWDDDSAPEPSKEEKPKRGRPKKDPEPEPEPEPPAEDEDEDEDSDDDDWDDDWDD